MSKYGDILRMKEDMRADMLNEAQQVSSNSIQVGGTHYKDMPIQPIEYIMKNGLGYLEGNVIKYVSRHTKKNGVEDIDKAIHYLNLIKEYTYGISKQ